MSEKKSSATNELVDITTPNDVTISMILMDTDVDDKCLESDPLKENMDDSSSSVTVSDESASDSFLSRITLQQARLETFVNSNSSHIFKMIMIILAVLYLAYFITALVFGATRDCVNVVPLVCLTCVTLAYLVFGFIWDHFGGDIKKNWMQPCLTCFETNRDWIKRLVACVLIGAVLSVIILTAIAEPRNLISLAGFVFFVLILFLFSEHRGQINWRPVFGGFCLQFMFAVIILKWDMGYRLFRFLGQEVQVFLGYTDVGAKMVFGKSFEDHYFAMKVLPVIIFFSCFISVLYHLGIMQAVIGKIAFVMRLMLGTTAAESLCAAGNIFVGQTEAPILIRPFLELMTKSELHAVMTGGFATIAGGVLAAYVAFGVPAEHLLCASVMNAPCALAVSKLLFPETEKSRICNKTHIKNQKSNYGNVLEAAAAGASASIGLVANIAANLIAFLALLAFVNAVLSWFGSFVCFPELSFEWICSYLFMPVAYLMGVEWKDAGSVGELIGTKTFLNEFVAYEKLAEFIKNRRECREGIILALKSEVISTYALCGFANLSSIGIQLGGLTPMAPNRAGDLAKVVIKALFGGIITCLMTASVAGLLVIQPPESSDFLCFTNGTNLVNGTELVNGTMGNITDTLLVNGTQPNSILYNILVNNTAAL